MEAAFGAAGGVAAALSVAWYVVRRAVGLVRAIDENTAATRELAAGQDRMNAILDSQGTRLARLEGETRRG